MKLQRHELCGCYDGREAVWAEDVEGLEAENQKLRAMLESQACADCPTICTDDCDVWQLLKETE